MYVRPAMDNYRCVFTYTLNEQACGLQRSLVFDSTGLWFPGLLAVLQTLCIGLYICGYIYIGIDGFKGRSQLLCVCAFFQSYIQLHLVLSSHQDRNGSQNPSNHYYAIFQRRRRRGDSPLFARPAGPVSPPGAPSASMSIALPCRVGGERGVSHINRCVRVIVCLAKRQGKGHGGGWRERMLVVREYETEEEGKAPHRPAAGLRSFLLLSMRAAKA